MVMFNPLSSSNTSIQHVFIQFNGYNERRWKG
jgi:hypothetical protein